MPIRSRLALLLGAPVPALRSLADDLRLTERMAWIDFGTLLSELSASRDTPSENAEEREIQELIAAGRLIPDRLQVGVVGRALQGNAGTGVLLTGFP